MGCQAIAIDPLVMLSSRSAVMSARNGNSGRSSGGKVHHARYFTGTGISALQEIEQLQGLIAETTLSSYSIVTYLCNIV